MRQSIVLLSSVLFLVSLAAVADPTTEQEVRQTIIRGNDYVKKNLVSEADDYSAEGAMEFWSSGGLLQEISAGGRPDGFDTFNVDVKHIQVSTVVPGKVAIAHYYSEGSFQPKGFPAVNNYRTRVSQVYVKEGGKWKIRSSHWSPITGGAGTSQTASTE